MMMARFNLERVKYSDYVSAPTISTVGILTDCASKDCIRFNELGIESEEAISEPQDESGKQNNYIVDESTSKRSGIPNYLSPFIMATYTEEVYENIRCLSLSVINILCQLGMAILESIFNTSDGVLAICDVNESLLPRLFKVSKLALTVGQSQGRSKDNNRRANFECAQA
ncbi:hypothetical protein R1sor_001178 [Riccia sorocarpa]|uniref:Uncharacterized protein n=1 Tax=Riccia sorocarpa TaxID=122646 RepID=A0ABD3GZE2_9MARC